MIVSDWVCKWECSGVCLFVCLFVCVFYDLWFILQPRNGDQTVDVDHTSGYPTVSRDNVTPMRQPMRKVHAVLSITGAEIPFIIANVQVVLTIAPKVCILLSRPKIVSFRWNSFRPPVGVMCRFYSVKYVWIPLLPTYISRSLLGFLGFPKGLASMDRKSPIRLPSRFDKLRVPVIRSLRDQIFVVDPQGKGPNSTSIRYEPIKLTHKERAQTALP